MGEEVEMQPIGGGPETQAQINRSLLQSMSDKFDKANETKVGKASFGFFVAFTVIFVVFAVVMIIVFWAGWVHLPPDPNQTTTVTVPDASVGFPQLKTTIYDINNTPSTLVQRAADGSINVGTVNVSDEKLQSLTVNGLAQISQIKGFSDPTGSRILYTDTQNTLAVGNPPGLADAVNANPGSVAQKTITGIAATDSIATQAWVNNVVQSIVVKQVGPIDVIPPDNSVGLDKLKSSIYSIATLPNTLVLRDGAGNINAQGITLTGGGSGFVSAIAGSFMINNGSSLMGNLDDSCIPESKVNLASYYTKTQVDFLVNRQVSLANLVPLNALTSQTSSLGNPYGFFFSRSEVNPNAPDPKTGYISQTILNLSETPSSTTTKYGSGNNLGSMTLGAALSNINQLGNAHKKLVMGFDDTNGAGVIQGAFGGNSAVDVPVWIQPGGGPTKVFGDLTVVGQINTNGYPFNSAFPGVNTNKVMMRIFRMIVDVYYNKSLSKDLVLGASTELFAMSDTYFAQNGQSLYYLAPPGSKTFDWDLYSELITPNVSATGYYYFELIYNVPAEIYKFFYYKLIFNDDYTLANYPGFLDSAFSDPVAKPNKIVFPVSKAFVFVQVYGCVNIPNGNGYTVNYILRPATVAELNLT